MTKQAIRTIIKTGVSTTCQCENVSHFDRTQATPYGNPGHNHGARFLRLTPVKTTQGVSHVCSDCFNDCHGGVGLE